MQQIYFIAGYAQMTTNRFYVNTKPSAKSKDGQKKPKILVGGPTPEEQIDAICQDRSWLILNTNHLKNTLNNSDKSFVDRANALKMLLQTFGPTPSSIRVINNEGKAKGQVYHAHVTNSTGNMFVLEWAVIDPNKRIIALVGFDSHENYEFRREPLQVKEIQRILDDVKNIQITKTAADKIQETKDKYAPKALAVSQFKR